ncbi:MAG: hypothetical protein K2P94_04170 [Rhodospirillaceae bacterium]|nr:hypothetical protein [Rhodospirillaceae bacterium]
MSVSFSRFILIAACGWMLAACTDASSLLAGGAKGYCKHGGGDPCTRPAPGNMPNTPPK